MKWLLRERGAVRNGEADVVLGDPGRGILVIEVKAGEIRRDDSGTWWAGPNRLDRSPFDQARDNKYALLKKLHELPDWPTDLKPISGHAVAFPDVDLDTMRGRLGLLGLDADSELVADQSMFVDSDEGRDELRRFLEVPSPRGARARASARRDRRRSTCCAPSGPSRSRSARCCGTSWSRASATSSG